MPKQPTQPIKKGAGQTPEEMAAQMALTQDGNRLYGNRKGNYKEISDQLKAEALTAAVDQQMELMQKVKERGRVDLDSMEEVTATADAYMESCKMAGAFPTMLGFAAACGYSRKHLYYYIDHHDNKTSRYIDALRSSWAAILAQMGLSRQASESVTIFLLKNAGQGMSDKAELDVTARPVDPLGPRLTEEELRERISQYIDLDEFEE